MKNLAIFIVLLLSLTTYTFAGQDIVYLQDGSIIHGTVLELTGTQLKFENNGGDILVYKMTDVLKLERGSRNQKSGQNNNFFQRKNFSKRAQITENSDKNTDTADSTKGHFIVQLQGGIFIPASNYVSSILVPGFSGEVLVGYAFSKTFTLGLESGYDSLPYNTEKIINELSLDGLPGVTLTLPSFIHIPLELVGQLNIDTGGAVKPYFLLGAGMAIDSFGGAETISYMGSTSTTNIPSHSDTNFELDPGFGVAFGISKEINIFIQGKVAMDFDPTSGSNPESSDGPIVTLPVQAGMKIGFN